jgi:hypothetical protein
MQTLNTGEVVASPALLDCGATGLFVNSNFVKVKNLTMRKLSQPVNVLNVDGTSNKAGKVLEVWETILQYCDHSECTIFAVTCLGKQNIILGLNWLCEHNPKVDWQMNEVNMSRCPNHCRTCLNEMNIKQKTVFKEAKCIHICHTGPMPLIGIDMVDIPDLTPYSDDDEDDDEPYVGEDVLKDGDHVFIATISCEAEFI